MAEPTHLLVVDGDPVARRRVVETTAATRFAWAEAATAREAMEAVRRVPPALVVLETVLPDVSGLGLARMIRETKGLEHVPIVVVSEHASEMDRILAFEMGVDDFVPKPFFPREFAARIQALLRRNRLRGNGGTPGESWSSGRLRLDQTTARVEVDGRPVDLTVSEFQVLATLIQRAGRVIGRREFMEVLRGPGAPQSDRAIDAHVKGIRRKLGSARDAVQTVRGIGYRFHDPPPRSRAAHEPEKSSSGSSSGR
jgi:DNA-binding response OmpR family regulator